MKRNLFLSMLIIGCFFIIGCSKKYNYNYEDTIVSAEIDENIIEVDNNSESGMVYFFPKESETDKSYVAYIYRNDDDISSEDSKNVLVEYKKYMKEIYQVSENEIKSFKGNSKEKVAKLSYSLLDDDNNIYSVDTKFINKGNDSIIIVSFINDKLDNYTKEAFKRAFNSIIINKKDL